MNYNQYLRSDHWKNKRKEVISKQGNKCRICGSVKELNIHHRRYYNYGESLLYKEKNAFLLPLCNDCHFLWHKLHGFKHIPFPRLRTILSLGVPKQIAFAHPYISIKGLRKRVQETQGELNRQVFPA